VIVPDMTRKYLVFVCLLSAAAAAGADAQLAVALPAADRFASQVEVTRTAYGIPHIRAENLAAGAYAMAFVQLEDYGPSVAMGLLRARGGLAMVFGRDSISGDFTGRRRYAEAVAKFHTLDPDIRDVYEGFAAGVNRYMELHPDEFPARMRPDFTAFDVLARETTAGPAQIPQRLSQALAREGDPAADAGSNAWAFAPSRTRSGRAILLRNPHLAWTAGYYEAHLTVPGVIDFYGDFRIGGPLVGIGGFNRDLGWATTNNDPVLRAIYALDAAPGLADHYLLDGVALPLTRELVTVEYANGAGLASETREFWTTPMGPVVHRGNGRILIVKSAGHDDVRESLQYLRMMQAKSLDEWKAAMRMRARVTSSFTYADRAGNIFYVWNASLPAFPHRVPTDTSIFPVRTTADMWTRYVPFDSLPQVLNPRGGYIQNANDAPQFTNLQQVLDLSRHPDYFPPPTLRLRSQLSLTLAARDPRKKMTLEDVMTRKMEYRMLLADRVKDELVRAVEASAPTGRVAEGLALVKAWDNQTAPDRTGGTLFELWWRQYADSAGFQPFATPWSTTALMTSPAGLADAARAVRSFAWAVAEAERRWGRLDVKWGDVHRFRIGAVDLPGGGCGGDLGCFRVITWRPDPDGKWYAVGGDGWVIGVEFGDTPKSYSVLAYGQSSRPDSPHSTDQLELFATGQYKRVAFTPAEIERSVVRRYRPGAR
jgi:acyl-homoserine-lactone acylase